MKLNFGLLLLLCVSSHCSAQARATVLPDACGDDTVKFDVTAAKEPRLRPLLRLPARRRLSLSKTRTMMIGPFMYATVRFGLDGAWAGANYNNSYFAVTVDPRSSSPLRELAIVALGMLKKNIDVASFTAEPGKVYYFAANVKVIPTGPRTNATYDFGLSQLDDDAGHYRVKAWKLATWKTQ
jgi:hypothetical protein